MINKTINVEVDIDVDYKSIEDLNHEIKNLEQEFETLSIGSERWEQLGNEIKKAKSQLKDIELTFEGLDREQRATALVDTFAGMTDAIAGAAAGLSLFGVESDALEKVEKNFGSILLVTQGVRGGLESVVKAQQLWPNSFGKATTAMKTFFTTGTIGAKALKAALASIGIGILIQGIIMIVENLDAIGEAFGFASDKGEEYAKVNEAAATAVNNLNTASEARIRLLRAEGAAEEDLIKIKLATAKQAERTLYSAYTDLEKASAGRVEDTEAEAQALLDARTAWQNAAAAVKELENAQRDLAEKPAKDAAEQAQREAEAAAKAAQAEANRRAQERKNRIKEIGLEYELLGKTAEEQARILAKREFDGRVVGLKESSEAYKQAYALYQAELTQIEADAEVERLKLAKEANNAIEAANKEFEDRTKNEYEQSLANVEQYYKEQELVVKQAYNNGEIDKETYDAKITELDTQKYQQLLTTAQDYGQSTTDLILEQINKEIEAREELAETTEQTEEAKRTAQMQTLQAAASVIGNLSGLFKEGSKAAKAAALADIATNTALGFVQGLDIAQKGAKATGPAAPFAFPIFYASQIASVLGAVGKAKQVLQSGGGGTTTGPSIAGVSNVNSIPQFQFGSTTQTTRQPLTQTATTTTEPLPIKAYVLAGDVDSAQQANAKINKVRKL